FIGSLALSLTVTSSGSMRSRPTRNVNGSTNVTAEPSTTRATGGCRPGSGERSVNCSSRTCTSVDDQLEPGGCLAPRHRTHIPSRHWKFANEASVVCPYADEVYSCRRNCE